MKNYVETGKVFCLEDNEGNKYRMKLEYDSDAMNPRTEWDNIGKMMCWHRNYNLGDYQDNHYSDAEDFLMSLVSEYTEISEDDFYDMEPQEQMDVVNKIDSIVMLPLYLYDHSGITISTGSFGDPWDSGQVGWIYIDKETVFKELCHYDETTKIYVPVTDENWKQAAAKCLEGEVNVYDHYLTGQVYGFVIEKLLGFADEDETDPEWDDEDSCWGFYGSDIEENGIYDHIGIGKHFHFVDDFDFDFETHTYSVTKNWAS